MRVEKLTKRMSAIALTLVMVLGLFAGLPGANLAVSAQVHTGQAGDNITWTLDTVTGEMDFTGTGPMWNWATNSAVPWHAHRHSITSVVIADGIITIGSHAFNGATNLTSVDIPVSVTFIGQRAFQTTPNLTSIDIPNSVTFIGGWAFQGAGFTSVDIPASVTYIGVGAFANSSSLTEIRVVPGNAHFRDIDGVLFNYAAILLHTYPQGRSAVHYAIPDSVTTIGDWAFSGVRSLTSVDIPDSVAHIGEWAFFNARSLTSVDIPDSVTYIGGSAFVNSPSLTEIRVALGNMYYRDIDGVLFNYAATVLYTYPAGKAALHYVIPDSVTTIVGSAFLGASSLASIDIPANVIYIGRQAFAWASSLTSATIRSRNATFGMDVFQGTHPDFTIFGFLGSTSEAYAADNGHNFVPLCDDCEEYPCVCPAVGDCCDNGIVYREAETNIRVTGMTFSYCSVPGQGGLPTPDRITQNASIFIDLTTETLHLDGRTIEAYSIRTNNRGERVWRAGGASLTPERFVRMLNRDLDLWICFRDFNPNARKPQGSGDEHNIIAFPAINRRPAAPRAVVNFEKRADLTGDTFGRWLLTTRVRSGETPVIMGAGLEIAVADAANRNRTPDSRGFGVFCADADGVVHGIPVLPLGLVNGNPRVVRTSYLIRTAPTANADGTFTAAGRPRRINVSSVLRAPNLRVNNNDILRVRANKSVLMNGVVTSHATRQDIPVGGVTGNIIIWTNATARRPASAHQTITR